jgi:hypothetical protein
MINKKKRVHHIRALNYKVQLVFYEVHRGKSRHSLENI